MVGKGEKESRVADCAVWTGLSSGKADPEPGGSPRVLGSGRLVADFGRSALAQGTFLGV